MTTYLAKIGELTLKGSNLKEFERRLVRNLHLALETVRAKVQLRAGRMYVTCDDADCPAVEFALGHLIGITGWAKATTCGNSIEEIRAAVMGLALEARSAGCRTFKIDARRINKRFPLGTYEINCRAADEVFDKGILCVDVHNPDITISIEVREQCYIYGAQHAGCRGLPVGASGRGLLLLSGGIDSPVAGYRMMRRGMHVDCAYFHAYPYTSDEAQRKVEDLAAAIANYGVDTHLNIIPFTQVQMRIRQRAPEAFSTLMLRMCMMRAAGLAAKVTGAQCLITGESLGQVASQTQENMAVTESACALPLLRPLVGMDKEEIIATARQIGTYDTSILPYEDCCVLFSPKHPVLRASLSEAKEIYGSMEIDPLIEEAFAQRVVKRYSARDCIASQYATLSDSEM